MQTKRHEQFYLGGEGGATKSSVVVMNDEGEIVYQATGEALNYHPIGIDLVRQHLVNLLDPALSFVAERGGTICAAVFGFAGLDWPADEERYNNIVHSVLGDGVTWQSVNDAVVNMYARCEGQYRAIVISGTGSNVYGANGDETDHAGGDGPWLSDEGSGFDAGSRVLHIVRKAFDGRVPDTLIVECALRHARVVTVPELIALVHKMERESPENMKSFVASFSVALDDAINQNDFQAKKIRDKLAKELAEGVIAVSRKLGMVNEKVCVSLVGSQFRMPGLANRVKKNISEFSRNAYFSDSEASGAVGAAQMAMKFIVKD